MRGDVKTEAEAGVLLSNAKAQHTKEGDWACGSLWDPVE